MNGDMGGFATFDNINNKLIDDLKVQLREGCKLQIAAASFSIYAYEALKEELERDKCVRTDIDYDYYAYLLSLTEVIPVDYGTRKGQKMEDLFFLGYQYMGAIYDSILR